MSDVTLLMSAVQSPDADRTAWLALADALQEDGRDDEAALIRETDRVAIDEAGVVVERPTYRLVMMDDGGSSESVEFDAEPTAAEITEACEEWVRGGDWGSDGASIDVRYTVTRHLTIDADDDGEETDGGLESVEVEADHDTLIGEAVGRYGEAARRSCGTDPGDHDWTSEGEGGCDSNPGVWSAGGTSMSFASHCRACGLHRNEHSCGSQRNPGEHDTVRYEMPDRWCVECQSDDCECESDDE